MACRLGSAQPLSEPILEYHLLETFSGINLSEILSKIHTFSFKKMHLKMLSGKWQSFCLSLHELTQNVKENYTMSDWRLKLLPVSLFVVRYSIHQTCLGHVNHANISKPLTHWGWDKMAAVSQTTLSNAFSWMKMSKFRLRFHSSLFLRVQLTITQHWFR